MWRIRLDTAARRLALEVRDADVLLAYFYTLDADQNILTQVQLPQALTWWQGLEDAHQGMLYLHGYGDRKLGQHKGILAVSAATGLPAWEEKELAFYGITEAGVLAYPAATPEATFSLLSFASGQGIASGISQQQAVEAVARYTGRRNKDCLYPLLYREGEEYFFQVQEFIKTTLSAAPVKALEYAETELYIFVSYYEEAAPGKLDNFLAVFDLEGNLHLKETIATGLHGIGSDTFLIFMHELYFVQQRNILQIYNLLA